MMMDIKVIYHKGCLKKNQYERQHYEKLHTKEKMIVNDNETRKFTANEPEPIKNIN